MTAHQQQPGPMQGRPPGPMAAPHQQQPGPMHGRQPQPSLAPRAAPPQDRAQAGRRKPSRIQPWLVIALILILAGGLAILVAMSGPDVPAVAPK
jgi:hypothetical protein